MQKPLATQQGRIHGYPSGVRSGRGSDEIYQPSSWAGAVTTARSRKKKAKHDRRTNRLTDGHSGLESRVHVTKNVMEGWTDGRTDRHGKV